MTETFRNKNYNGQGSEAIMNHEIWQRRQKNEL